MKVRVCYYIYEPARREDRSTVLCSLEKCMKDSTSPIAHTWAVYTPIPLGKISLAAHCLDAVLQSVVCYRVPLSTAYPTLCVA